MSEGTVSATKKFLGSPGPGPAGDRSTDQADGKADTPSLANELVARAAGLAPRITERAGEAERNRRLHDETIKEIAEAGIYEMLSPRMFGGHELFLGDMVRVIKALSPLCASTAWTTAFYICHNWMWTLLPEEAQREIFAGGPSALGPIMLAPSVSAEKVDGGFLVSGQAKWATGSAHASWCMVGGVVKSAESGPPDMRFFAMPWSDVSVIDTWHTSGMCATASHDVKVDNVFVPEHRAVAIVEARAGQAPGSALHPNPLYHTPMTPFLCVVAVAPLVGVARGVVDYAIERAQSWTSTYHQTKQMENPAMQIRLAKADLAARAAEVLLDDLILELEAATRAGPVDVVHRATMRAKASYIATQCRDLVADLAQSSGASAHFLDSPIQRAHRDLTMGVCHVVFDQDPTMELHGKLLVGITPPVILA